MLEVGKAPQARGHISDQLYDKFILSSLYDVHVTVVYIMYICVCLRLKGLHAIFKRND